jgi:hypothetical protein
MTLAVILLVAIAVILIAERSVEHLLFAIAALSFVAAVLVLIVGDAQRASLLSLILAAAIAGASTTKYNLSGLKLIVTDFPLAFAGTVPFIVTQYPRVASAVLTGSITLVLGTIVTLKYVAGAPLSLEFRILLFGLTLFGVAIAYRISGGAESFRRIAAEHRCFFSSFMASFIDSLFWRQFGKLALSDITDDPLPLMAAVPGSNSDQVDIIVIQHESIFDPRVYGLPVEANVEEFLSPKNGLNGGLNVDIFGGGSWQSEFSLLTGLSSASFGSNGYYLFKRGAGRFHHSLPHALSALGYKTMLTSSCRRNFLSYDEFYRSISVGERIFADDFPPPFNLRQFEATSSDKLFLEAALGAFIDRLSADPTPRFLYALTNFNHGPHDRRLSSPGHHEGERAFAFASFPDAQYAEYYARLAETATTWQRLKSELASRFPGRPMLIAHYGDHQPVLTRRIERKRGLPEDARRQFRTFYAIEGLNISPDQFRPERGTDLDIAFLGLSILQRAGLPLDPIFATRASLVEECGKAYFASSSERKRRFHRTLVNVGTIDVAPATRPPSPG